MNEAQTQLVRLTTTGIEPISLADAKGFLRLDPGDTTDDVLLGGLITAARQYAEKFCRRTFLIGDQYRFSMDHFPLAYLRESAFWNVPLDEMYESEQIYLFQRTDRLAIRMPVGVVSSVDAITYKDSSGTSQTLDPSAYTLVQSDDTDPLIYPAYGVGWPATIFYPGAVQVMFTAGEAPEQTAVLAMQQLVAHWYRNREAVVMESGVTPQQVPFAAESLLWMSRNLEF